MVGTGRQGYSTAGARSHDDIELALAATEVCNHRVQPSANPFYCDNRRTPGFGFGVRDIIPTATVIVLCGELDTCQIVSRKFAAYKSLATSRNTGQPSEADTPKYML